MGSRAPQDPLARPLLYSETLCFTLRLAHVLIFGRDYFPNLQYGLVDTSMTLANGNCQIAVASHTFLCLDIILNVCVLFSIIFSVKIVASCDMVLQNFPMDTQHCFLILGSCKYRFITHGYVNVSE